ncbi:uncharacterized protein LOC132722430 isoform X2 [Ruditapes philippinarum]|uniref:uncharacterized protein LOC132722430 isoform X2 n=1 Tax=Ruditapes philippinarum TaxID=129788 RepID=UPI00295B5304|nr:uncharacterized protein LOC132722430 isoform X2 [Ruditapes philippinarum]
MEKVYSDISYKISVLLFFGYFLTLSCQLECDRRIYCHDWQIDSQETCCYLSAGDNCNNDSRRLCDFEMGYNCDFGKCTGKYNLSVTFVDDTSINLTWSPFLPSGSRYNYTVLYSTEFQTDPLMYSSHLVGTKSGYSLQWLTPGIWYFIRVGVWAGQAYKNLTEVVMTKTKATDHCLYNGRRVPVGEQLIVDCEESCYCSNTGRFHCVPVCSKQHPNTRACSDIEARENCCDLVQHCSYDTCTYLGKPVQHEYSWVIDCAENCTCYDGSVTCVPLCADVMVPENCSNPVLTKSEDGCCDVYECHELENVCEYLNVSHRVGTWFQRDDCDICTCTPSREIKCVNLSRCTAAALPEPSVTCPDPAPIDNQCCNQIICDKQSEDSDVLTSYTITKYPVSSSILVRFQFISTKIELSAVQMTLFYTSDVNNINFTSWASNVTVKFSDVINTSSDTLEFRDFGKPYVLYSVDKNYFLVIPKLFKNIYYYVKLKIDFDRTQRAIPEYISETKVVQIPGLHVGAPNHLMTRTHKVYFTAINSSSNSAFVSWTLSESLLNNISSFVIQYKPFSRADWQYTERVIFSDTNIMLKCLYHSSWYEAQLIAHPGERRLATTFFNTSSIKEVSNSKYSLSLNVSIRASSIIMAWNRLPNKIAADVNNIEILWTRSHNEDTLLKSCVSANSDTYVLQDLIPGCIYTVWLGISRKDGTITFTNRMHFVSLHHYNSKHSENQHSIVVAITVACVSLVAMVVAIATVIYLLKCKHRASYLEHTSFENRIFQIYDNKEGEL